MRRGEENAKSEREEPECLVGVLMAWSEQEKETNAQEVEILSGLEMEARAGEETTRVRLDRAHHWVAFPGLGLDKVCCTTKIFQTAHLSLHVPSGSYFLCLDSLESSKVRAGRVFSYPSTNRTTRQNKYRHNIKTADS